MTDEEQPAAEQETARPVLRVVKGDPTAEELAALLAVVAAKGAGSAEPPPPRPRSAWGDPSRTVRAPLTVGPDGWRRSAFPH